MQPLVLAVGHWNREANDLDDAEFGSQKLLLYMPHRCYYVAVKSLIERTVQIHHHYSLMELEQERH